jgi:hypothetical protein
MRRILAYAMSAGLSLTTFAAAAEDDKRRAVALGTPPLGAEQDSAAAAPKEAQPGSAAPAGGRPENRWRYRFVRGRWWYWMPDRRWSYFDGNRWVAYRSAGGFSAERVDPALLHLETKEGVLGVRKWAQPKGQAAGVGGAPAPGAGWTMSGTRGSIGGASSFAPSPPPRAGGMGGAPRGR